MYELPAGLSKNNKNIYGKWRYRHPTKFDGKQCCLTKFIEGLPAIVLPEEAIKIANDLNKAFSTEECRPKLKTSGLTVLAEEFIKSERERRRENSGNMRRRFIEECAAVRKTAAQLEHINLRDLTDGLLTDWWHNRNQFNKPCYIKSPCTQRNHKHILKLFVGFLLLKGCTGLERNIFNFRNGDVSANFKKEEPKKRNRITIQQFYKIRQLAIDDGVQWLADAMTIALVTGLRRGDIVSLEFNGNIVDGKIRTVIHKSESQLGLVRAAHKQITLKNNREILDIVNRALISRHLAARETKEAVELRPAIHIIHDYTARIRKAKGKTHYSQITKDRLSKTFKKYRNRLPELEPLAAHEKCSFHEIRALWVAARKNLGHNIKDIQKDAAHQHESTTNKYGDGHAIQYEELAYCLTEEDMRNHALWEDEHQDDLTSTIAIKKAGGQ
jgi:integrase